MKKNVFLNLLLFELRLWPRTMGQTILPMVYFSMICLLFPLILGPNPKALSLIGPIVFWVGMLLTCFLSSDQLLKSERHDLLGLLILSPRPFYRIILAKAVAYWIKTILPLTLLVFLFGYLYYMQPPVILMTVMTLNVGTPSLVLLCTMGSAVFFHSNMSAYLLSLLILPLIIPVIILGSGASILTMGNLSAKGPMALLLACLLLCIVCIPRAASAILRATYE